MNTLLFQIQFYSGKENWLTVDAHIVLFCSSLLSLSVIRTVLPATSPECLLLRLCAEIYPSIFYRFSLLPSTASLHNPQGGLCNERKY